MDGDEELAVRIVIAEGILSGAEARALGDEAARGAQGLLERLHADGRISEPTFASLRARVTEQANAKRASQVTARDAAGAGAPDQARTWDHLPGAGSGPGDRADPEVFPAPGWDRYEPIRLLGQGGMGRVFLARDLRLDRKVAIKFVRGDDPELARRIVGEARAQARVNDDRVCKVYEVGEVRGRVYIAMQHIDGRPLSELGAELTVEQKAIVMRGAALGVAEAHRAGLIHRDLKPSNIMVERGVDGELRPFVMDFGLARDWTGGATMTGTVLGTPPYMAPEQARGEVEQLDRRADVYSLGATLYALLVGRAPIEGGNPLEVLTRVATDEPTRPRAIDPDVPADLEAIAMKCLEKERAARYDSARALADDLGRFLGGEPVAARSAAGLGYRLRKRLRRHARLVAGVTVAVALVAVALGYALHERGQAARREALARRFTERVERIEAMARYAALAPVHDLRPDRARLAHAMDELAAEVRAEGDLAAGPGHYALGRGHLALGDDERAARRPRGGVGARLPRAAGRVRAGARRGAPLPARAARGRAPAGRAARAAAPGRRAPPPRAGAALPARERRRGGGIARVRRGADRVLRGPLRRRARAARRGRRRPQRARVVLRGAAPARRGPAGARRGTLGPGRGGADRRRSRGRATRARGRRRDRGE